MSGSAGWSDFLTALKVPRGFWAQQGFMFLSGNHLGPFLDELPGVTSGLGVCRDVRNREPSKKHTKTRIFATNECVVAFL